MKIILRLILLTTVLILSGCTSGAQLSRAEQEKLDPSLQKLLLGEPLPAGNYNISETSDGQKLYGVIITSTNPDDLEKAGVVPNTIVGEIVTARITVEEMKKAVRLDSVQKIKNSSKSFSN